MQSPTRVWIVRHAESTFNAEKRYQGRDDTAVLTAKGREAAAAVAECLGGEPIDLILSSPLRRARQTAETVASAWQSAQRGGAFPGAGPSPAGAGAEYAAVIDPRRLPAPLTLRCKA